MDEFVCFKGFLCILLAAVTHAVGTTVSDSCTYWRHLADSISQDKGLGILKTTCIDPNTQDHCAQLHCSADFKYHTSIPSTPTIELNFCYGVVFNHCDKPKPSVDYYLLVRDKNVTVNERVTHNTTQKVNGLSFHLSGLITAEVFLYFEMVKKNSTVEFSTKSKVKVTNEILSKAYWPKELQLDLIPKTEILVPRCDKRTPIPERRTAACKNQAITTNKAVVAKSTTTKPVEPKSDAEISTAGPSDSSSSNPMSPSVRFDAFLTNAVDSLWTSSIAPSTASAYQSETYNQACDPTSMAVTCSHGEMCLKMEDKPRCRCQFQYALSPVSGFCENLETTKTASTLTFMPTSATPGAVHSGQKDKSHSNRNLIIGVSVGGVALIVIIVVTIVFVVRKRRARTFRHQLLLNADDSEVIM